MRYSKAELYALLRQDLMAWIEMVFTILNPGKTFRRNWHIEAIAWYLTLCATGDIKRLVINIPPRCLKTESVSVAFATWLLGHNPSEKLICVSYNQDLSSHFSNMRRTVMESDIYREVFAKTRLSPRKNSAEAFLTTKQGACFATSILAKLTGLGGKFILIDDPNKPDEVLSNPRRQAVNNWFSGTLSSRLDDPSEGCMVLIQQRVHVSDLSGYVLEKGDWTHLNLPAIAPEDMSIPIGDGRSYRFLQGELLHPERLTREFLEGQRQVMGDYDFEAQYLQNPVPESGNLIPVESFRHYPMEPGRQSGDLVAQSWDAAFTASSQSDYSVCTTWLYRNGRCYLLDLYRKRLTYADLKTRIVELALLYGADTVLLERAGAGVPLAEELTEHSSLSIEEIVPVGSKEERMMPGTLAIRSGMVFLPEDADWLPDFIQECAAFPKGKHDDQVDSLSQFLIWVRQIRQASTQFNNIQEAIQHRAREEQSGPINTKDDMKNYFLKNQHIWRNKDGNQWF